MKNLLYLLLLISSPCAAQFYIGPVPAPSSGYGAAGPLDVMTTRYTNPLNPTQDCIIFHPKDTSTTRPTVFFMHGFSGNYSSVYQVFFEHLASHGYAAVFVPYPATTNVQGNYDIMKNGFQIAARDFSQIVDTMRVGLVGYSFGGGAAYYMADELMTTLGWGSQGRFISTIAPWYSLNAPNSKLASLAGDTKMLNFILQDDGVCDHRQAIEIYNNTPSIAISEKDVVYVPESHVSGYTYVADHYSFVSALANPYDALDAYVFNRMITALADYTFTGNLTAKDIALGGGSTAQVTLPGGMTPLVVVDSPQPTRPTSYYTWPCDSSVNPRSIYCDSITAVSTVRSTTETKIVAMSLEPSVAGTLLRLQIDPSAMGHEIQIYNVQGTLVHHQNINSTTEHIDLKLAPSIYLLRVGPEVHKFYIK